MVSLIRSRLRRPISALSLGPNEARLLFDFVVSFGAVVVGLTFQALFIGPANHIELLAVLPVSVILFNTLIGVYSRFKLATGRVKALVLLVSVMLSTGVGALTGADAAILFLWAVQTWPLLAVARLLLNIRNSKNRSVVNTIRRRGSTLIVGGAGYIGSHVVDQLLKAGESVRVLDRLMYGSDSLASFRNNKNFELIEGDVTDIAKVTEAMRGASAVVHMAGLVGDPACAVDPDFTRHQNIIATRMAKLVAQSMGIYRFVFASSCSVYGTSDEEVSENSPLSPVSLYAETKIDSERELLSFVPDDFFITVLRFATVFGHSYRPRFDLVANLFTAQAMNEGVITVVGPHQWRPFIHCRDLARAIVATLQAKPALIQNQILNVGDQRLNLTILQLAEKVRDVVSKIRPVEIVVRDDVEDRRNYAVSFNKIKSLLGFQAATSLDEGIAEMAQHFRQGNYVNYKEEVYSNVAVTRKVVRDFRDPLQAGHLYAPLMAGNSGS